MYTIGKISKMFHIPVSTLRYYDKEGLFPNLERSSGIRQFSDKEIETMKLIECLKRSGMEIKDIKQFIEWCSIGSETYQQRYEMFLKRKERVERELQQMQKTLDMLRYKCWYYEQALKDGNEDRILAMLPNHLPEDIQDIVRTFQFDTGSFGISAAGTAKRSKFGKSGIQFFWILHFGDY